MPQDLAWLCIINPEDIYLSMIASTHNNFPHFSKNTAFHKLPVYINPKCSCRCAAVSRVEVKSVAHVIDENLSA